MRLDRGTRLGPYEILEPVGAGGMGEVYKARDTRLDRVVAIKVLPAELAAHPELRQRLEREARAVSSLNHPHICALYDIGQQDGTDFLVLEFLEGETLASRLKRGPLPVDAALRCAAEVAEALDQAHRQGVVHRDLKPANIMLTKSGAKLLDFGLARIRESKRTAAEDATAALTRDLTSQGTILGTWQYMAPEQLEAKEADARSDIFAFGAVLYEMLTGSKAFHGGSQASLIAAILTAQPAPVSNSNASVPAGLDHIVQACLAKDPDGRWQSARDLARELKWIADAAPAESTLTKATATKPRGPVIAWGIAAAAAMAALSILWIHVREPAPEQRSIRFTVTTGSRLPSQVRISPDGTKLAFVGQNAEGKAVLWVRPLDKLQAQALPGTDSTEYPFWSPDSRHLAFFDANQGRLKRIDSAGGQPQTLCDAVGSAGGDWAGNGTILFGAGSTIYRVAAAGGVPVPVTGGAKGGNHAYPVFLPDGRHFLYLDRADDIGFAPRKDRRVFMGSLDSKEATPLIETSYNVAFSPANPATKTPAHLIFVHDGVLMAQEIDTASWRIEGETSRIADEIATDIPYSFADFSVSRNGVLALNPAVHQHELVWLDRSGKRLGAGIPVTRYAHPNLSPDGRQVVFDEHDVKSLQAKLWKLDVERGELSLFETEGNAPIFFRDGSAVAFLCRIGDKTAICRKPSGGAGSKEILWDSGGKKIPMDFAPGAMSYTDVAHGRELWILPLLGEQRPFRFYPNDRGERHGIFSADGKWIAYTSSETGDFEVYVQPFPATGQKWKVSSHGGSEPRWRRDGREIYYVTWDGKMMAVPVETSAGFRADVPRMLFQTSADPLFPDLSIVYAVSADGQRFLVNMAMDERSAAPITVITNWTAGLKR